VISFVLLSGFHVHNIPTPLFHDLPEITLCEEAIFQFLASPPLASFPVERLSESLPGRKVDWKSVERLKKSCSPQQQALHLLRLWREQNKDQDKLLSIIQGQFVYIHSRDLGIKKTELNLANLDPFSVRP